MTKTMSFFGRDERARASRLRSLCVPTRDARGRYMIVFGHRRTRVAKELGVPVRAVVKKLEEIAHIIAQGQENYGAGEFVLH